MNNLTFFLSVPAGHVDAIPEKRESAAFLKNWMMAVIAGLSGAILLTALIFCLCYYRRRRKTVDKGKSDSQQLFIVNLCLPIFYF